MAHLSVIPLKNLNSPKAAAIIVNNLRLIADLFSQMPREWHGVETVTGTLTFTPPVDTTASAVAFLKSEPRSVAAYAHAIQNVDGSVTLKVFTSSFALSTTATEVVWIVMED